MAHSRSYTLDGPIPYWRIWLARWFGVRLPDPPCPSVLGGHGEYPDVPCQLRLNHGGQHFNHKKLRDGSETYRWDTADDTAHKAG